MGLEGKGSWPHSGCRGRRSWLGEAMMVANRQRRSSAAGDGEDGVGGDAGLPALRSSMERSGASSGAFGHSGGVERRWHIKLYIVRVVSGVSARH